MNPDEATAYIAMGSNRDRPVSQFGAALRRIGRADGLRLLAVSPYYRTAPLQPADDLQPQPDYLNAVVAVGTRLPPHWLLDELQRIENRQGRVRTRRWGPRTLDLDILLYDGRHVNSPRLKLPHPELHKRAFVLYPLYDVAPRVTIPGRGPLLQWLRRCDRTQVKRLPAAWSGRNMG